MCGIAAISGWMRGRRFSCSLNTRELEEMDRKALSVQRHFKKIKET